MPYRLPLPHPGSLTPLQTHPRVPPTTLKHLQFAKHHLQCRFYTSRHICMTIGHVLRFSLREASSLKNGWISGLWEKYLGLSMWGEACGLSNLEIRHPPSPPSPSSSSSCSTSSSCLHFLSVFSNRGWRDRVINQGTKDSKVLRLLWHQILKI